MQSDSPLVGSRRGIKLALFIAITFLLSGAGWLASHWYAGNLLHDEKKHVTAALTPIEASLSATLIQRLTLLHGLAAFIEHELKSTDGIQLPEFEYFATRLTRQTKDIRCLYAAPQGAAHFAFLFDPNGNPLIKGALGNPTTDACNTPAVEQGYGLFIREPGNMPGQGRQLNAQRSIYHQADYWGSVGINMDFATLLRQAGIDKLPASLSLALISNNNIIHGDSRILAAKPVIRPIETSGIRWQLAAAPRQGWGANTGHLLWIFKAKILFIVFLITGIAYLIINRQTHLSREVAVQTEALTKTTAELEKAQARFKHLAYHDYLTGSANRHLLWERMEQVLKSIQRHNQNAALLCLDLDHFKQINDSLGHDMGDALLAAMAKRLKICIREEDMVARLGGDEFVVLLANIDDASGAREVALKILYAVRQPLKLNTHEVIMTTSIGITIAPDDGKDADQLLKNADLALYKAKEQGRDNYHFFTEEMNTQILHDLALGNELIESMKKREFVLHFQPLVSLKDQTISGMEALIRWQHPEHGLTGPNEFLAVAEDTGLIIQLGEWVLTEACQSTVAIHTAGLESFTVAINLSKRQFRDPNLVKLIQKTLRKTSLKPKYLTLELNEDVLSENMEQTAAILSRLKSLGLSISIDGFGSGYSSISHLKKLSIDTIKVSPSFIQKIPDDSDHMEITAAIIAVAHKLGMTVVGGGVETGAQRNFLEKNQCDFGQGYIFGRPMSSHDLLQSKGVSLGH